MLEDIETEETKKLFYDTLTEVGYEVIYAERGEEAIEVAQQQLPVLIFMGVVFASEPNGFQIMREITHNPVTKHIPVIPVTKKDLNLAVPGAIDFLSPPYTKEKILTELEKIE